MSREHQENEYINLRLTKHSDCILSDPRSRRINTWSSWTPDHNWTRTFAKENSSVKRFLLFPPLSFFLFRSPPPPAITQLRATSNLLIDANLRWLLRVTGRALQPYDAGKTIPKNFFSSRTWTLMTENRTRSKLPSSPSSSFLSLSARITPSSVAKNNEKDPTSSQKEAPANCRC